MTQSPIELDAQQTTGLLASLEEQQLPQCPECQCRPTSVRQSFRLPQRTEFEFRRCGHRFAASPEALRPALRAMTK